MDFLFALLGEIFTTPAAIAATPPIPETGLLFKNFFQAEAGSLNAGTVVQRRITAESVYQENGIEYVDNCGKEKRAIGYPHITDDSTTYVSTTAVGPYLKGRVEVRAWFVSAKTPPAPGLRVVVRNTSMGGTTDTLPYTNREYDQGSRSESFIAALGDGHKSKFLALQTGANRFTYEIKRGNQVVETGEFAANIDIRLQDETRTRTISRPKHELHCEPIDQHDDHKDRHKR